MVPASRSIPRISLLIALLVSLVSFSSPVHPTYAQSIAPFRVYMAFEDGPTDAYTPEILDILAQYGAKASFSIAGYQIKGKEAILQREVREGHALINHLWSEPGGYAGSADEAVIKSYLDTEKAIREALGGEVGRYDAQVKMFWQPGGGAKPLPAIDGVQAITYNWMVDSGDCGGGMEGKDYFDPAVIDNVLNEPVSKNVFWNVYDYGDGVVIAFHDINRVTARVLPAILGELQSAGATFLALPRPWDQVGTLAVRIGVPPAEGAGIPGATMHAATLALARVRSEPTQSHNIITTLPMNTTVIAIGRTKGWIQVQYDGGVGWIARDLLKIYGPIPNLPLVQ
ncbi:MAG: SH3 domain-containing protein [Anaerolineae bacterium]|nr:SH3 domain-containing protein [Anaerolineae bacterium]